MRIKEFELQDTTVLEIGRFAILWNQFEHDWCNNNCTPSKIKEIANTTQMDIEKQRALSEVLNRRRMWFDQLEVDYVRDSLHPGNARASAEEDMKLMQDFLKQTGDSLESGCLLAIYRIRNNLMHGLKMLEELDGQIELFRAANAVLESV